MGSKVFKFRSVELVMWVSLNPGRDFVLEFDTSGNIATQTNKK